jgi:hypothetical protein
MARKHDEQKRFAKLAAEMGGKQIFNQLEAEYEKVGEAAIDGLWEERPMDYLAAVVFLGSQDPRWARLLKETLLDHVGEFGVPELPH